MDIDFTNISYIEVENKDISKIYINDILVWEKPSIEYAGLIFTALEPSTIGLANKASNCTMLYSTNSRSWTEFTTSDTISLGTDQKLYIKGTITSDLNESDYTQFSMTGNIEASGNIMSIVSDDISLKTIPYSYCFYNLFNLCNSLVKAPELPATTLKDNCYKKMFSGCTSLTEAPELPATELDEYCYSNMFYGCNELTSVSTLPATTLKPYCYELMFSNCTKLVTAPLLPAMELDERCYSYMFYYCISLTNAPLLPATELATACYLYMFWLCINLENAPELPATSLTSSCYAGMFRNCRNLKATPELPANRLRSNCYSLMFSYCTSLTTPASLSATELELSCYNEMFLGCTGIKLYSSTLPFHNKPYRIPTSGSGIDASSALYNMFRDTGGDNIGTPSINTNYYLEIDDSSALQFRGDGKIGISLLNSTAKMYYKTEHNPEWKEVTMPFTKLNTYYKVFFVGAQTNATNTDYTLFTTEGEVRASGSIMALFDGKSTFTSSYACYRMFADCRSLRSTPSLPATTLTARCYDHMFDNCSSIELTPSQLPATTLAEYCYNFMFSGCTKLRSCANLSATTLAPYCYCSMFRNCTSLTKAPSLPATSLAEGCYDSMFNLCTGLTTAPTLPATTLAEGCYNSMFINCSSLVTIPSLPATTLAPTCYAGMFLSCTSLTKLPELRAKTLPNYCYLLMFYLCSNIKIYTSSGTGHTKSYRIPSSGTGTIATRSLTNMFYGTGGDNIGTPNVNITYYIPN